MDHWDAWRQIQRLIENFRRVQQEYERLQRVYAQLAQPPVLDVQIQKLISDQQWMLASARAPILTRDLLAEFTKAQGVLSQPTALIATAQTLEAAMRPMLNLQRLAVRDAEIRALVERLNVDFAQAPFLAELDLSVDAVPGAGAPGDDAIGGKAESQLIQLVSPELLEALRRVRFEPFTLLERVRHHPGMMREMTPREFERLTAELLEDLGYEDVLLTPRSRDGGCDVIATRRLGGFSTVYAFECKRYDPDRPVGVLYARALLGTITHPTSRAEYGVLVTTSRFTSGAHNFILTEPRLDGRDFDGIVTWLQQGGGRRKGTQRTKRRTR